MDCDEKQSLIVAFLSICGLFVIVLIVVLYFIWRVSWFRYTTKLPKIGGSCNIFLRITLIWSVGKKLFKAGVKRSSRSQSREDATCVTRVEIQVNSFSQHIFHSKHIFSTYFPFQTIFQEWDTLTNQPSKRKDVNQDKIYFQALFLREDEGTDYESVRSLS